MNQQPPVKHRCKYRNFRQKCSLAFGVPEMKVVSVRRTPPITLARHAVAYGLFHKYGLNFCQIGAILGGKHHTTIRYGIDRFQRLMAEDPEMPEKMAKLRVFPTDRAPQRGKKLWQPTT